MDKITTEYVMDKLDMFQHRFGKIDKFGWWDLEISIPFFAHHARFIPFKKRIGLKIH